MGEIEDQEDGAFPFPITQVMLDSGRLAVDEMLDASEFQGGTVAREWLLEEAFMAMLRAIPQKELEEKMREFLRRGGDGVRGVVPETEVRRG